MASRKILSIMERNNVNPQTFDHFDYIEATDQLSDLELINHPRKRKIVELFATKCLQKIKSEEQNSNPQKHQNFISRMKMYESLRIQKLSAMKFIEDKYDTKNRQLKFYPKVNQTHSTQPGRYWKDKDGFEVIQKEQSIRTPNTSIFQDNKPIHQ